MSLYLLNDMLNEMEPLRPSRMLNQHFGLGLLPEDLVTPLTIRPSHSYLHGRYYRPWTVDRKDSGSILNCGKEKFEVNLDVQHFRPDEISVKVMDDYVVIEGKHEEKQDEHGYISRQFVRRYLLPKEYEIKNVQSSLSSDGILTITAPRCSVSDSQERIIPVVHTGPRNTTKEEGKGDQNKTGTKK